MTERTSYLSRTPAWIAPGESILSPPTGLDFGRGAVAADPRGALIGTSVMVPAAQPEMPA